MDLGVFPEVLPFADPALTSALRLNDLSGRHDAGLDPAFVAASRETSPLRAAV
jgi:hypothetical protein